MEQPLITIVLALYEPRLDWLEEQLLSLNAQTYPNLELLVRDDASSETIFNQACALLRSCITAFPYRIWRNQVNQGSNKTFEMLAQEATGIYIAFCDQDDRWKPHKLSTLYSALQQPEITLVCSDMDVIDGEGKHVADSITRLRPRHVFCSGSNLAPILLYKCFVAGCAMLCRTEVVQAAIPFPCSMVHDHWISLFCAMQGKILSLPDRLLEYRLHGGNQTDVLHGVKTKEDYYKNHLMSFVQRCDELSKRIDLPELALAQRWAAARQANYQREKNSMKELWALRAQNVSTTLFELIGLRLPSPLFHLAVYLIQRGQI